MNHLDTKQALLAYHPSTEVDGAFQQQMLTFLNDHPMDFYRRTLTVGHFTASAWIVNPSHDRFLLTHHRKLNRWLQLGGHIEEDANLAEAAMREALEESGLSDLKLVSPDIFDLDIHSIPERKGDPEHLHLDVRFLIEANDETPLRISNESNDLAWVDKDTIKHLHPETSMLRMLAKTPMH